MNSIFTACKAYIDLKILSSNEHLASYCNFSSYGLEGCELGENKLEDRHNRRLASCGEQLATF